LRPGPVIAMSRILLIAALLVCLMAAVKDGRVTREAGLTGSCATVAAPRGQAPGAWERCTPGKLTGAPELTRQGCTMVGTVGAAAYWRCEAQLASASAAPPVLLP
jgi:hypothetical protein